MKDDLILSSLKEAIIDAFFKQQAIYSNATQNMTYYGGHAAALIQKIMDSPEYKELVEDIAKDLPARTKEKAREAVYQKLEEKVLGETLKQLSDSGSYSLDSTIRATVFEAVRSQAERLAYEMVENDEKIKAVIREKLGDGDYNLTINISAKK